MTRHNGPGSRAPTRPPVARARPTSAAVLLAVTTLAFSACVASTARRPGDNRPIRGCEVEVYNDSDRTITAYYRQRGDNAPSEQVNIGIISPRDYREIQVPCTLRRIMVLGRDLSSGEEVIPTGVTLEDGERKLANLRFPRK